MKWIVVVVAVLGFGCNDKGEQRVSPGGPGQGPGGQSAKEAMFLVCNAEATSGAKGTSKAQAMAEYIETNVHHPEVLKLLRSLGAEERATSDQRLRDAARGYGIDDCPLANAR